MTLTVKADEFNDAVQVVRDWLPQAEAELKFRAISEDEDEILQLIDDHEVFVQSINQSINQSVDTQSKQYSAMCRRRIRGTFSPILV